MRLMQKYVTNMWDLKLKTITNCQLALPFVILMKIQVLEICSHMVGSPTINVPILIIWAICSWGGCNINLIDISIMWALLSIWAIWNIWLLISMKGYIKPMVTPYGSMTNITINLTHCPILSSASVTMTSSGLTISTIERLYSFSITWSTLTSSEIDIICRRITLKFTAYLSNLRCSILIFWVCNINWASSKEIAPCLLVKYTTTDSNSLPNPPRIYSSNSSSVIV